MTHFRVSESHQPHTPRTIITSDFQQVRVGHIQFSPTQKTVIRVDHRDIAASPGRHSEKTVLLRAFITYFSEGPPQLTWAVGLQRPSLYCGTPLDAFNTVCVLIVVGFFQE